MQIKKIGENKKSGRVVLNISGTTPSFLNTVRRAVMEFVPTMAVELVEFVKNDSILYDEIVANRLGLVPLRTDLKSYIPKDECTCEGEGCAKCTIKLTLKTKSAGLITAGQMKSKDPKIVPVNENIPVAKLLKGQEMEFEATAQLGRGHEHVKWSPGHVWYNHKQKIKIDSKKIGNPKDFVANAPMDVFTVKVGKVEFDEKKYEKYLTTIKTLDAWNHEALKLENEKDAFVLYIESWGQLAHKEMLTEAANVINSQCKAFVNALKEAR